MQCAIIYICKKIEKGYVYMEIEVRGACEHNLKELSINLPIGSIIGITGVSGSGKSSLADVIARYGYKNYVSTLSGILKSNILKNEHASVDTINNLPAVLSIDVVNSINNPRSTLSTVTGLHNYLRRLFVDHGKNFCMNCEKEITESIFSILESGKIDYELVLELELSKDFAKILDSLSAYIDVKDIKYYDKDGKETIKKSLRFYSVVYIENKLDYNLAYLSEILSKKLGVILKAILPGIKRAIDLQSETICLDCKKIIRKINKKMFSFNISYEDGGGECRECGGYGKTISIDSELLIIDLKKSIMAGAIKFVNNNGIQYTTITEKFLEAVGKEYGFTLKQPISELTSIQRDILFFGSNKQIKFTDRVGGKKEVYYKGIANYLAESYQKGKGKSVLESYLKEEVCKNCNGTRLDKTVSSVKINNKSIGDLLKLSISDLKLVILDWLKFSENTKFQRILLKIKGILELYEEVGCGYLSLDRECITLSGGELQRLRLCSFMCSQINNMCVILDEPTCGLHPVDIERLLNVLFRLRDLGNTLIIVEHNKTLLKHCDYIVDLGPYGGAKGGELLFADKVCNISKYDTFTTKYLLEKQVDKKPKEEYFFEDKLNFEHLCINNLKDISVSLPLKNLICICGVSGSGKSTFVNSALLPRLKQESILVENLGQRNSIRSIVSNVGSILNLSDKIANIFYKLNTKIDKSSYLLNSKKGKCSSCLGKGYIMNDSELLDLCPACLGRCFNEDILATLYKSNTIKDILDMSIDELASVIDDKYIEEVLKICIEMGLGYLTLSRTSKTLSKGELQRLKLVGLVKEKTNNSIILLDEPTKGLHNKDFMNLYSILRELVNRDNTVIVIEHNMDFVLQSDYVIEFGPGSGEAGGNLLYSGAPGGLLLKSTPTAIALTHIEPMQEEKSESAQIGSIEINKIKWSYNGIDIELNKNSLNVINASDEIVSVLSNYINMEYIKSVNPSILYTYEENFDDINLSNTPIVRYVDFSSTKFRRDSNLIDVLNIDADISRLYAYASDIHLNEEYKSVFSLESKYGKCKHCNGLGVIPNIDLSIILKDGILTKSAEKFLKNSSNYAIAKKQLKSLYKVDISKPYLEMSELEKDIFVYGDIDKKFIVDGNITYWEGVNNLIVRQTKYYPDKDDSTRLKKSIIKGVCKFCNGELLSDEYRNVRFLDYNFSDFITTPIFKLNEEMSNLELSSILINRVKDILNLLTLYDLGDKTLKTLTSELNAYQNACLKLITFIMNNIYGSVMALSNMENVDSRHISLLKDCLKHLTERNTVVVISSSEFTL